MEENNLTVAEINFFKQLQFEKKNLEDKVNYLESRLSSIEENNELILSALTQTQNSIKSLENKLNLVRQDLKEKENIIDTSEFYKENILETIQNLSAEVKSLKKILKQQNYTEDVEMLKANLNDLEKAFSQYAREKSKLEFELTSMSEELLFHISNEGSLAKQIKKLENEKLELKADNKTLLHGISEDKAKSIDIYERFLKTTPDWDSSIPDLNLSEKDFKTFNEVVSLTPFNMEDKNVNLWKEILEVEKNCQKEILREEKQEKKEGKFMLKKFGRTVNELEDSGRNCQDFQLLAFYFPDIMTTVQESFSSPESHSKHSNTLTEGAFTNVTCKDFIQLNQPESFRIVETVSTASQTEFFENISPVLLPRLVEKNQLKEDVFQEEVQYFSQKEEEIKSKKNCQIFLNYKNCDLDMDIYRSCRKLSVLPEEEIDDIFIKKNSLDNSYSLKKECLKSKNYFPEEFNRTKCFKPKPNEMPSSSNLLIQPKLSQNDLSNSDNNCNASYFEETKLKLLDSELLSIMPPRDAFRQPLSFDSYLDPQNNKNSSLIRQISDPTQNTVCPSSLSRRCLNKKGERGSLIKKSGSTCRPLRLPCDKDNEKEEEKVYKVRFNAPEQILGSKLNFKEMDSNPLTTLKNNKNYRMISRFRLEIEDKINFHKFLEKQFSSNAEHKNSIYFKETRTKNLLCNNSKAFKKCFCDIVEGLYTVKLDVDFSDSNDELNHFCPLKKRKKSDFSSFSTDDSPKKCPSIENSYPSIELDIPCIDIKHMPIMKSTCDTNIDSVNLPRDKLFILQSCISNLKSDLNLNKCLPTYVSECEKLFEVGPYKLNDATKSETILKNVANFELVNFSFSDTNIYDDIVQKKSSNFSMQSKGEQDDAEKDINLDDVENKDYENSNRASFDISEGSESDTLTYKTVNTHLFPSSSDCDSDTYVTIWSDRSSILERKSSDLSEDSSSPYTTPPDTSSASFCTPPDNYSPILYSLKQYPN